MEYGASSADLYIKWKNRPRRTDPVCRGLFDWHSEEEACDYVQHHGRAGKAQDIGRLGLHVINDVAAGGGAGHEGRQKHWPLAGNIKKTVTITVTVF